jgi:RNA polymerase sigma factor (sigma-70 family)
MPPAATAEVAFNLPGATDRELLARFASDRDQQAFAEIVRRHGSLVLSVCRRVLRSAAEADDAFQATFLVLARKAGSMGWQDSVVGWLYQTAHRTALQASRARARRQRREQRAAAAKAEAENQAGNASVEDLATILDDALQRLPKNLRDAVVLCHLEGLSRAEAAERLGVSEGAIKDRLERGREQLRVRLSGRGVTWSAALLATTLVASSAQAATTSGSVLAQSCAAYATGQAVGGASASVLSLAEGVLKMLVFEKLKAAAMALASCVLVGAFAYGMLVDVPDRFEKGIRGEVMEVTAGDHPSITVMLEEFETALTLDVASDAKVAIAFADGKLAEIAKGSRVSLRLASDHRTVNEIHAAGETHGAIVRSVSPNGESLTVQLGEDEDELSPEVVKPLAKNAIVRIGGLPAKRSQIYSGMQTQIEMSADGKTIHAVYGQVPDERLISGRLVSVDVAGKAIKLAQEAEESEVESWLRIDADELITFDGKSTKIESLKPGSWVAARLNSDQSTIEALVATAGEESGEEEAASAE